MLAALDELGLGAQVTYAGAATVTNQSWSAFAVSRQQRGDLVGDEVDMVEIR